MALVRCPVCDEMFDSWSSNDFEGCCSPRCLRIYRNRCDENFDRNAKLDAKRLESMMNRIKQCSVCGAKFYDKTRFGNEKLCDMCKMQRSLGVMTLAHMRDDGPLTYRQKLQVDFDTQQPDLWRRSGWWTKAMHAYARQRYVNEHNLFYKVAKKRGSPLEQMADKILAKYDKVGY